MREREYLRERGGSSGCLWPGMMARVEERVNRRKKCGSEKNLRERERPLDQAYAFCNDLSN